MPLKWFYFGHTDLKIQLNATPLQVISGEISEDIERCNDSE